MLRIIDVSESPEKMRPTKITFLSILAALLILVDDTDAWRRRSCGPPRDCRLYSWSSWSSCSTSECGKQGSQTRTRSIYSYPACGGACPSLMVETRQCHGKTLVNCTLTAWSQWSACTTPCGLSGTQTSSRHRIITEQCGGKCASTFRKTRPCPQLSPCMNGGSLKDNTCFCKEGFSGVCCDKGKQRK